MTSGRSFQPQAFCDNKYQLTYWPPVHLSSVSIFIQHFPRVLFEIKLKNESVPKKFI